MNTVNYQGEEYFLIKKGKATIWVNEKNQVAPPAISLEIKRLAVQAGIIPECEPKATGSEDMARRLKAKKGFTVKVNLKKEAE